MGWGGAARFRVRVAGGGARGAIWFGVGALKNIKYTAKGKIPVGVGFGISTEKDVQKYVSLGADAVIVGSANIKIMETTPTNKIENKISVFTKKLKNKTK